MNKIGIFVHPRWEAARDLGRKLESALREKVREVWLTAAWDEKASREHLPGTDLLVCVGGDGTVLWAARAVVPHPVAILGINMGRLGFLAELGPEEAWDRLPQVLEGGGRIEERTMLQAVAPGGRTYHGLNDAVVGRGTAGRPVYVDVSVDGQRLALYRADAVVVATATGSTAYSFSAGGPILYPESQQLVLTPVAPHLTGSHSLVLSPDAAVELKVVTEHRAVLSVDGQEDLPLASGDTVSVKRSPHLARFLRLSGPADFYSTVAERLGWLRVVDASDHPERIEDPDSPK
ncbi:MAG: NAD(+)/NADH kinase [Chloroflexi bacterium]|nr:NAD(+)/NADH kinase [Chloroflexota bacterium]